MYDYENFIADLKLAQENNKQATERILLYFKPLINKYKYVGNTPDEDLLCELYHAAFLCIKRFKCDNNDLEKFLKEAKEILSEKN
ncbi:MAG: helix-turn-helix domain-containing protein [Treponema sp.]|nr:helix-turn-helix domain-containing protein [Treponema sp.]